MIIKFFSWKHPISYINLLLYSFLLCGVLFFLRGLHIPTNDSFMNSWLLKDFDYNHTFYLPTLSIICIFIQALVINKIIMLFKLSQEINLLPAYIYITLAAIFPQMILLNAASISMFFVLLLVYNLLTMFNIEDASRRVFSMSLFIGLGTILYPPFIFFLLVVLICLPIIKNPNWREVAIIPFGFLIPFYLIGLYFYVTADLKVYFEIIRNTLPKIGLIIPKADTWILITLTYVIILFIISYINTLRQSENKELVKYRQIFHIFFIISLAIFIFSSTNKLLSGYHLLIPFTVFISNIFRESINKRLREILIIILLIVIVYSQMNLFPIVMNELY